MTLLDDAKRLADDDPVEADDGQDYPAFCRLCLRYKPHAPDCPWLSMPRLVALVEAAEQVTDDEPVYYDEAHHRVECLSCGAEAPGHGPLEAHEPDCAHQALVAALRGEGVPA